MQKNILDALTRLTTPGSETSEGKNATRLTWSFLLVIIGSLAQAYFGINTTGASAQILGGILGLLWNSSVYTNARTDVKQVVGQILSQPAAQKVMQEMGIPSALPFKLGDYSGIPIKPRTGRVTPTNIGDPPEPPLTLKDAVNSPIQPHTYTIRLIPLTGPIQDIPFEGTRSAACQEADRLRTLPENQGAKIHVL